MAAKKKTKTGKKKSNKAMEFIVAQLKRSPKITYAELKDRATKKRLTIYPIMYGRAQALLGLVATSPRGSRKKKGKRGPGRPRKTAGRRGRPRKVGTPLAAVQDLVSNLESHVRENADLRDTLEKIRTMIDRAL